MDRCIPSCADADRSLDNNHSSKIFPPLKICLIDCISNDEHTSS